MPQIRDKSQISVSVFGKTRNNLIPYSNMDIDSNADGVVDGFESLVGAGITGISSLDATEYCQKVQITASTTTNPYTIRRLYSAPFTVIPGEVYSWSLYVKVSGNVYVLVGLVLYNSSDVFQTTIWSSNITSTSWVTTKTENRTIPVNCYKARFYISVNPITIGDTGTAWFKNALLEKAAFVGNYIQTGVKSTLSPNSPLLNY